MRLRRSVLVITLLLHPAMARAGQIVTGLGAGGAPQVSVFNSAATTSLASFLAYPANFSGGVRVAVGDVNGDGVADTITGVGPGAAAHVKVFDGVTGALLASFFAFEPGFTGGVFVAAGDVNGDRIADIIAGADAGAGPHVKVFDGRTRQELQSFFAYPATFTGGVRVGAGDVNGDGAADIVTGAGPGAASHIKVFDGRSGAMIRSFFAFESNFIGGVFVAAGDVTGDAMADVVVGADAGGAPHVKVFDAVTISEIRSFLAYAPQFAGGVRVAAGDVNGDGIADIITGAGPGGAAHVKAFDGGTLAVTASFLASAPGFTGGVYVAASSFRPITATLVATAHLGFQQGINLVQSAIDRLASDDFPAACGMLGAFLLQVEAQSGKKLTVAEAAQLTLLASDDRSTLGCSLPDWRH
jgi:hypothetical protein